MLRTTSHYLDLLHNVCITPQWFESSRIAPRPHSQESGGEDPCDEREESRNSEDVEVTSDDVIVHREGLNVPLQLQHADQSEGSHLRAGKSDGSQRGRI